MQAKICFKQRGIMYVGGSIYSLANKPKLDEQKAKENEKKENPKPKLAFDSAFKKQRSGLRIYIEKYGSGEEIQKGSKITAHYEGWLAKDYKKFDSSYDKKKPFSFTAGEGGVIKGWEEAVQGLKQGAKVQLKIPAKLAYGKSGVSSLGIPPNADLIFKIEIVKVRQPKETEETKTSIKV